MILVGGLGKRLGNKVKSTPKPLLKINKKPFLEIILNNLIKKGFKKIIICAGYLGHKIDNFIKKKKFKAKIIVSHDGKKLLGTGGAVKKAIKYINKNFFLMYGDTFLPISFIKIQNAFLNQTKPVLMTILKNKNNYDKSNVHYYKKKIIYNKKFPSKNMEYIDYGLLIMNKNIFKNLRKKNFPLSALLSDLSLKNLIYGHKVYKRFYEIGTLRGINDTKKFFKKNEK